METNNSNMNRLRYSLQEHGFRFHDERGLRIADCAVEVVFSQLWGRKQRARLEPGLCSEGQTSVSDMHGEGMRITLRTEHAGGLELKYIIQQYPVRPFLLLRLSVRNISAQTLYLHELVLLEASDGQLLLEEPDRGVDFFKVGWHGWAYSGLRNKNDHEPRTLLSYLARRQYTNPTTPILRRQGEFHSEGWGILAGERAALVIGLASMADQFGQVRVNCRSGEGNLRLATQTDGLLLEPGASLDSEWGYLEVVPLPDPDPAREYVEAVARQMGARTQLTPPLQWTHWYHFYQKINAQKFLDNLEAIASIRSKVPFQVAQLDDGYQTAWGEWTTTNAKFPNGLADLAEQVRKAGYTPGLWLSPFVVQPNSSIDREYPEWLLKDRQGSAINAGFFYKFFGRALDVTHPAAQEYLRDLTEKLTRQWGFELLKIDYCYAAALPGKRYDPKSTRAQALRRGLEIIRQAAGNETFLLGCGCPFGPAIGVVDAMRIGPDTAPKWEPWFNWLPWAERLFHREPSPPALRNSLRHVLNLSCLHRRWWWNDPDCLLVRDKETHLTEAEVLSRVTLVGLSGGMVVDSDDLTRLPPERLELLSLLSPLLSPGGQPMDILEREMPEVYHVPVQGAAGQWHLVGIFNWQDYPASKRLSLLNLRIAPGQNVYVFDFWAQHLWQTTQTELVFPEIPAHGCKLLRICTPEGGVPSLLGDTLHITQGLEIVKWQPTKRRLEFRTLDMGRQVRGDLWLKLPAQSLFAVCNGTPLDVVEEGQDIYRLPLHYTGKAKVDLFN